MATGPIVLVVFSMLFVGLMVAFVRKIAARKRALFADTPPEHLARRDASSDEKSTADALGPTDLPADTTEHANRDEQPEDLERKQPEVAKSETESKTQPIIDEKLAVGLRRTQSGFLGRLNTLLGRSQQLDVGVIDEMEEILLTADVGVRLSMQLLDELRTAVKNKSIKTPDELREALKSKMREALTKGMATDHTDPLATSHKPHVILFVGVNGVGKTTTIGKIAHRYKTDMGKNVVLAAGDTFRAAAVQQLEVWGERVGCKVVRADEGTDPASVIFNAVQHATNNNIDVLLADTAGRLHTKSGLMDEIGKIKRAAEKACPGAPHEVWLVVDATTGQNAVQQATQFNEKLGLTGIILTKLDGTAKGGVVVAIADTVGIPVRFVGVGEKPEDLRPFHADSFIDALFAS